MIPNLQVYRNAVASGRAIHSPAAIATFFITFALLLAADLSSKVVAFDRLMISQLRTPPAKVEIASRTVVAIPKLLHFHVTANQGAVFGIGQGKRWLFVLVSVAAIGYLLYLFATTARRHWPTHLLLAGFLAGVIGNMWDRLTIGYVRDMLWMLPNIKWIDLFPFLPDSLRGYDVFPWIFNLADLYLVAGVIITIAYMLFAKQKSLEPQMNTDGHRLKEEVNGSAPQ